MNDAFNRRMHNLQYGDVVRPIDGSDPIIMVLANYDIFGNADLDIFAGINLTGPHTGSRCVALRSAYERVPNVRSLMGTKGWEYAVKVFNEQMKIRGILPND